MCTVSYLPIKNGFLLTSNRDEWNKRLPALEPRKYVVHNTEVCFPKDQQANGTWIAMSAQYTLCLLNGAFVKHQQQASYRLSRGIMLLDFFKYLNAESFANEYDFDGIEPFCLLIKSNLNTDFFEIRWDGSDIHLKALDANAANIWSSVTLYTEEIINQRKSWFEDWLKNHTTYSREEIVHFHKFAGVGDRGNDVMMKRENGVETVSITSIIFDQQTLNMNYFDLQTNLIHYCTLD